MFKTNTKFLHIMGSLWILLYTGGCLWETSESEDIKTTGLHLEVGIVEEPDETVTISMDLFVGGRWGNRVHLTGDDRWEVNGEPAKSGVVPTSLDRTYEITLIRSDERLSTTVTLPEKPIISQLDPADHVEWNEDLTVYWDPLPSAELIQVSVDGPCITAQSTLYSEDPGTHTTLPLAGYRDAVPCSLEVEVSRAEAFEVNRSFESGKVTVLGYATTHIDYVDI